MRIKMFNIKNPGRVQAGGGEAAADVQPEGVGRPGPGQPAHQYSVIVPRRAALSSADW